MQLKASAYDPPALSCAYRDEKTETAQRAGPAAPIAGSGAIGIVVTSVVMCV
jgi:hypothetical protein